MTHCEEPEDRAEPTGWAGLWGARGPTAPASLDLYGQSSTAHELGGT